MGEPGIGKSRLAAEALGSIDAHVVRGRCLPYGAGITYWPVVEVIKQLGAVPSDRAAAAAIRSLLGESDEGTSAEEIGWAFRKLLEEQAPLVVVFDDIQWGEESFLDLIEHVALLSSGSPLLLLCMARPELLDSRPTWPVTMRLAPLDSGEAADLIGTEVPEQLRSRIAVVAAGNPLFIGEMLAMTQEADEDLEVPASLKALLAARLDQLDPAERRVLERGSVEGEVFHRGAVQALAPEEQQVTPRLAALVRRELIRSDRPQFAGEDGFRFRHLLIRDAAYDALPKATRAELHERFAAWLEQRGELVELDEILGYHLEQAHRYRQELGQPDPALAVHAAEHLAAAGHNAAWRYDDRAAARLLKRALELTRPARLDVMLEVDLATTFADRDPIQAATIADAAAERADATGDRAGGLLARVAATHLGLLAEADPAIDELEQLAKSALLPLEQEKNYAGLAYVWSVLGYGVENFVGHHEEWARAAEQALRYSRLAGRRTTDLFSLPEALIFGPRPADEVLLTLDGLLPENPHPWLLLCRSWLLTMLGRFDEANTIVRESGNRIHELTGDARGDVMLGLIAVTAGRHEDAVAHLERYCDFLRATGQQGYLVTFAPMMSRSLCALGRYDEAQPLAQFGCEVAGERDWASQTLWRQAQALIEAARGRYEEAESLAREAVAISDRTDGLNAQAAALCDLAEVLNAAGKSSDAETVLAQALERYERKMNLAQAAQTRDRRAELQDGGSR